MNKDQLLAYLHRVLDEGRPPAYSDGLTLLAYGLAARIVATKGLGTRLSAADRINLDRVWGQPELPDLVQAHLESIRRTTPDVRSFVEDSMAAAQAAGIEPTGEGAEAAAKARWLAQASLALPAARDQSIADIEVISDIALGKGLPALDVPGESLEAWLDTTIAFLDSYNLCLGGPRRQLRNRNHPGRRTTTLLVD